MAIRRRTRARELALQYLYSADLLGAGEAQDLESFLWQQTRDEGVAAFARDLANGALRHRDSIDDEIRRVAKNWDFQRIATIDRNILRIGVYELLHRGDVPPRVTLNEAIELAKRFSTEESGGFVNGLLDRIRADHGLDAAAASPLARGAGGPAPDPEGESDEPSGDDDV